jgi:hypothetical protein
MSRSTATKEINLDSLVVDYSLKKKEQDYLKKVVDTLNSKIKEEFENRGIAEHIVGDVKATISITPREEVNELQSIEILKRTLSDSPELLSDIIKTKEYIDQDALERAVYSNKVDVAVLAPAVTIKPPTVTLRLGKVKN